jgi:hypothetical protein
MLQIVSILTCSAVALLFSLEAQALPDSTMPTKVVATPAAKGFCGRGYYRKYGHCRPYAGPQAFGLPYIEPPAVRLPYVEPTVALPYVELPVRLPYIEPPAVRLPYAELPTRLPYVEVPTRLPYVEPPMVGLPYVELPVLGVPHSCQDGFSYHAAHHRCERI